ncbi:hypothetical protein EWM64_g966 [Hericium alpestre]|uniref:Uncharacterized protein n=1 Tax=Hericium alpestre TaxID=135208 RepID=A0A4Z0A8G7_9AGAM|nr:hypothetical protein EWM64_g966 [Hericium alpestre]
MSLPFLFRLPDAGEPALPALSLSVFGIRMAAATLMRDATAIADINVNDAAGHGHGRQ